MNPMHVFFIHAFVIVLILWLMFGFICGLATAPNNDMSPQIKTSDLLLYYRLDKHPKAQDVVIVYINDTRYVGRNADNVLMVLSFLIAGITILYSSYVLYDVFYTNKSAFTSFDMLQYKKQIEQRNTSSSSYWYEQGGFDALLKLNPDVVGWVEIEDTNINYPILQGDDDLEYASKDFKGEGSISGSIYLSASNDGDFGDYYNIVYGHHMANGAMFGDIEKFMDEDYFFSHQKGTLQTPTTNYNLHVFACVFTDAYDSMIYGIKEGTFDSHPELMQYIKDNATQLDVDYLEGYTPEKVTAFSTCGNAVTNGRIVIFADTTPVDWWADTGSDTEENIVRQAMGHILANGNKHWALLNLICVILTFLVLLPIFRIKKKYRQRSYSKEKIGEIDTYTEWLENGGGKVSDLVESIYKNLQNFLVRMTVGVVLEIYLVIAAVIAFLLTENITMPMVMSDKWTWLMVLIFGLAIVADMVCFRFYGKHPYMIEDILKDFAEKYNRGEDYNAKQPATV